MLRLQKYAVKGYIMDLENHKKLADLIKTADLSYTWDKLQNRSHGYPPVKDLPSEDFPF